MKLRTRFQLLVITVMTAIAILPGGAFAAKPASTSTPPYQRAYVQHDCWAKGTGTCTSAATADRSSGRMTGASNSFARQDSTVTGTAFAFSRGGMTTSVNLPPKGASSVTFTVDALINSASAARSNPLQAAYAEVYMFVYATAGSASCTDCRVSVHRTIADSNGGNEFPESVTNQNQTFTFELKSASGQRLKGSVELYIWLTQTAWVGYSPDQLLPIEGSAEASGDGILQSVAARFTG